MSAEFRKYDVLKPVTPDEASLKSIAKDWAEGMGDVLSGHKGKIVDLASKLGHTLLRKEEPVRVK